MSKLSSTISIPHARSDSNETRTSELSNSGDSAISRQSREGDIDWRTSKSIILWGSGAWTAVRARC